MGRDREMDRVTRLLDGARDGRSGTVVLQGEAGIGKTALLDRIASGAGDLRLVRGVGIESETELAFSGLHLMLHPHIDRFGALPARQAAALRSAFGVGDGPAGDRFLIGAATLTLLSELAADRPLACLVDDAQWLDTASLDALLFAARRLGADRIAMVFAVRDGARPFPGHGLDVVRLAGLDRAAAEQLVTAHAPALTVPVRERLLDEAAGNPLALIELASALQSRPARHAGPLPVGGRVQETFRRRLAEMPDAARRLLLVVAADATADLGVVLRAGEALGLTPADLGPAEEAGLVVLDGEEVRFRHPLIRAVTYQDAPHHRRIEVHGALAATLAGDGHADRRAWHLAAAVTGPDEDVAAELERVAHRAGRRGGSAAVAAAYERAARLSTAAESKARRLVQAARAAYDAGRPDQATRLAAEAEHHTADAGIVAEATFVRAQVAYERTSPGRGRGTGAAGRGADRRERPRAGGIDADRGRLVRPGRRRARPGAAERRPAPPDRASGRVGEGAGRRGPDRLRAPGRRRGPARPARSPRCAPCSRRRGTVSSRTSSTTSSAASWGCSWPPTVPRPSCWSGWRRRPGPRARSACCPTSWSPSRSAGCCSATCAARTRPRRRACRWPPTSAWTSRSPRSGASRCGWSLTRSGRAPWRPTSASTPMCTRPTRRWRRGASASSTSPAGAPRPPWSGWTRCAPAPRGTTC
ncbi:ATP-binding protein [Actinomadura madurae]|uniref:ATP-binding protein n=1 Tax=Actinomadura madurae TaxID=1993 RepID=UPI0020D25552|nr:AAA family ATPase [Actinomadura madurae]MCQ0005729.1 AAA family ATPase [Actinomadura madurae]